MLELREHGLVVRGRDLQVLGGVQVRHVGGLLEVADEHGAAHLAECALRRTRAVAPAARRAAARRSTCTRASSASCAVTSSDAESMPCSASFSRSAASSRTSALPSAITRLSDGPEDHEGDRAVALHLDLRRLHRRAARAEHLQHLRNRLRAERQRGDARGAVRAEDVAQPELVGDDEHGRIDLPRPGPERRHHDRDLEHARDDRPASRSAPAPTGTSPCRSGRTGRRSRSQSIFSPSISPGSSSDAPVGALEYALVVTADCSIALADCARRTSADVPAAARATSSSSHAKTVRLDLAAVIASNRADIASSPCCADVLDDLEHAPRSVRVEDARRLRARAAPARVRLGHLAQRRTRSGPSDTPASVDRDDAARHVRRPRARQVGDEPRDLLRRAESARTGCPPTSFARSSPVSRYGSVMRVGT